MSECQKKCGDCCRIIFLPVARDFCITQDIRRWIELHGITVVRVKGKRLYRIPIACSQLEGDLCRDYQGRPVLCKEAPCYKALLNL